MNKVRRQCRLLLNTPDNCSRTPLSLAAAVRHGKAVKLLLAREDVNSNMRNHDSLPPSPLAPMKHKRAVELRYPKPANLRTPSRLNPSKTRSFYIIIPNSPLNLRLSPNSWTRPQILRQPATPPSPGYFYLLLWGLQQFRGCRCLPSPFLSFPSGFPILS